jgi:hypothetical protein
VRSDSYLHFEEKKPNFRGVKSPVRPRSVKTGRGKESNLLSQGNFKLLMKESPDQWKRRQLSLCDVLSGTWHFWGLWTIGTHILII